MKKLAGLASITLLILPLSGCMVSEGRYLQKVAEAERLASDSGDLKQRYDALTAENVLLRATVERLEQSLAALKSEKENLSRDLAGLSSERKELVQDLKSNQSESLQRISELRQRIADLDANNDQLRIEINGLKQDLASVRKAGENAVLETSRTYELFLEKLKAEISLGTVTISELKGKITLNMADEILFEPGSVEVKPDGLPRLRKVAQVLKPLKDKSIRIVGHSDDLPVNGALSARYQTNWGVSAARAVSVTRFLQGEGVNPESLSAASCGEYRPVTANASEEGRARNRRIEIVLVPKEP